MIQLFFFFFRKAITPFFFFVMHINLKVNYLNFESQMIIKDIFPDNFLLLSNS